MKKLLLACAGLLCILGLCVVAWTRITASGERLGQAPESHPRESRPPQSTLVAASELSTDRDQVADEHDSSTTKSKEELLSEFWGHRWASVRAELEEMGYSLEGEAPEVAPWEEVEDHFHQALLTLPHNATESMLRILQINLDKESLVRWWKVSMERDPNEGELESLLQVARRYYGKFKPLIDRCLAEELVCRQAMWDRQQYAAAPLVDLGVEPASEPQDYYVHESRMHKGWSFSFAARPENCPGWNAAIRQLDSVRDQYHQELNDVIAFYR